MIPFSFSQPDSVEQADAHWDDSDRMYLAGGTTMLDLMKLNVFKPSRLVSIRPVLDQTVTRNEDVLIIGAGCTMSQLADDDQVDSKLPAIRQSLILAASPQIRNMATIGGNLLQRTRSAYFRHTDMRWPTEDTNNPVDGFGENVDTSGMAVLGNDGGLVAKYPGDFAIAVAAFGGKVQIASREGPRTVALADFYKIPRDGYHYGTSLKDGELISAIEIPITPALQNSFYLKIRERSSYAFALVSAAVGLELDGNTIRDAAVGLGGLASVPWESREAKSALIGKPASDETFQQAADAALADAQPPSGLEYKIPLAKRTIVRALRTLRDEGPPDDARLWAMQHGRG